MIMMSHPKRKKTYVTARFSSKNIALNWEIGNKLGNIPDESEKTRGV